MIIVLKLFLSLASILILSSLFVISESLVQDEWKKFRIVGDFYLQNGKTDYQIQQIPYKMTNGTITNIEAKSSANQISITVDSDEDGILEIKIPRNIADATIGFSMDEFFVLLDNQEIDFNEKHLTNLDAICYRHLEIAFTKNTSIIHIIGTSALTSSSFNLHPYYPIECLAHPSPKLQIKSDILPENISCKEHLKLVIKSSDNSPACVRPSNAEKLIQRGWASHEIETKPKPQILSFSPVLFKGAGVHLDDEEFTSNDLLRLEYLKKDLDRLLEDPDIEREDRKEYSDKRDMIQQYAQKAFDAGVSFELIEMLWEKSVHPSDSIGILEKKAAFPIVSMGGISIGSDAYSVEGQSVGKPTALRIGIMEDQFTKESLEKTDKMVRAYLGDEIDIVYYKDVYMPWVS